MAGKDNLIGKGFDANPGNINRNGRPRKLPDLDVIVADVLGKEIGINNRTEAEILISVLLKQAKKGNTRAAEILLDRAYGKPKQDIEQKTVIYSVDVTDDEANKIAAAVFKQIF